MNKDVSCASRSGVVSNITPENIAVNIISMSACSACHAKGLCSAFEQEEKVIYVPNIGQKIKQGDRVNVFMQTTMGLKAAFIAYILPVAIVIIFLLALIELGINELWAGVASLVSLVLYYFVIYLNQNKLKKQFSFFIEKAD